MCGPRSFNRARSLAACPLYLPRSIGVGDTDSMRFQCLVCLLLASLAYGQAAPPAKPPRRAGQAPK